MHFKLGAAAIGALAEGDATPVHHMTPHSYCEMVLGLKIVSTSKF